MENLLDMLGVYQSYAEELLEIRNELFGKVVSLADKYNLNRNIAMQHFSKTFSAIAETGDFEHYGEGSD